MFDLVITLGIAAVLLTCAVFLIRKAYRAWWVETKITVEDRGSAIIATVTKGSKTREYYHTKGDGWASLETGQAVNPALRKKLLDHKSAKEAREFIGETVKGDDNQ